LLHNIALRINKQRQRKRINGENGEESGIRRRRKYVAK